MDIIYVLIIIAAAWTLLFLVLKYILKKDLSDDKGVTLMPLFIMVRTQRFTAIIDRIATKRPSFWKLVGNMSTAFSVGLATYSVYFLITNLLKFFYAPAGAAPVFVPVVGITIKPESIPSYIFSIAVVLITHEGMHGILARVENISIKSSGVFLLFLLPGGFVEQDEEDYEKAEPASRERVASAGSFANLLVGLAALFLILSAFTYPNPKGVLVTKVSEEASQSIHPYEAIIKIDNWEINEATLFQEIATKKDSVTLYGKKATYIVQLDEEFEGTIAELLGEAQSKLGITETEYYYPAKIGGLDPYIEHSVFWTLFWLQMIANGVAIFNMLPAKPFDGGAMLSVLIERLFGKTRRAAFAEKVMTVLFWSTVILNMAMTYITWGLFQI